MTETFSDNITPIRSAERMLALFRGHATHSGTHRDPYPESEPGSTAVKWKIKNTASTDPITVTAALWEMHLAGTRPLGIIPFFISSATAEGLSHFGSIDADIYDQSILESIRRRIYELKLPLVATRSKSNGLHLFPFLKEAEPTVLLRSTLKKLLPLLGLSQTTEIFPKQDLGIGNWICMPYLGCNNWRDNNSVLPNDGTYGGNIKRQQGLEEMGGGMELLRFLQYAEEKRTTIEELLSFVKEEPKKSKKAKVEPARSGGAVAAHGPCDSPCDFSDGPKCLHDAFGEGRIPLDGKNRLLFNSLTYLKKADPDGWEDRAREHATHMDPNADVEGMIKTHRKKDYYYQCKEDPLASRCDSKVCRTRRFGISGGGGSKAQLFVEKIDRKITQEKTFILYIGEQTIEVEADVLNSMRRLNIEALRQIDKAYMLMKEDDYLNMINGALEAGTVLEITEDEKRGAEFRELLSIFCRDYGKNRMKQEMKIGVAWLDEDENCYYFKLEALQKYIKNTDKTNKLGTNRKACIQALRELGGHDTRKDTGDKRPDGSQEQIRVWCISDSSLDVFTVEVEPPPIPQNEV